jgi:hypothetical protein
MLEEAILPFKLTVAVLLVLAVGAVILLPRYGHPRRKVVLNSCIMSVALFIPSCLGIELLMDLARHGKFSYRSAGEITDPHVRLPTSATEITVFKYGSGHDVRFSVSNDDLMEWLQNHRAERGDKRPDSTFGAIVPAHFSKYGWPFNDDKEDLEKYNGPPAPNGAGFTVWYSRNNGIAYLHRSFW